MPQTCTFDVNAMTTDTGNAVDNLHSEGHVTSVHTRAGAEVVNNGLCMVLDDASRALNADEAIY